ncbi:MAG TPA: hypothetical protein VFH88_10945 [Candidatus Krumholzibacteria bacterium]|nr:hypothetical protein [Candidatus Krumholzibacteria bacterium]
MKFASGSTAGVSVVVLVATLACTARAADNPPAMGFDASHSDAKAMALADRTMQAMGGRAAWDAVRTIGWTIFKRTHVWDKWTGDYRLEADSLLVIMNVNTGKGRVWNHGREVTDDAKRDEVLKKAMSIWINDSYWLLMPYKLKDTGVTLHYMGEQKTEDGRDADTVQLTFAGVGDTPDNRYLVWIDRKTGLVSQWSYFEKASDTEPGFTRPWTDWTSFGAIKISTGRGRFDVTGVHVSNDADPQAFVAP